MLSELNPTQVLEYYGLNRGQTNTSVASWLYSYAARLFPLIAVSQLPHPGVERGSGHPRGVMRILILSANGIIRVLNVVSRILIKSTKVILLLAFRALMFACAQVISFMFDLAELTAGFARHILTFLRFSLERLFLNTPLESLHSRKQLSSLPRSNRPRLLPRISLNMRKKIGAALVVVCAASLVGAAYPFLGLEFNYALFSARQGFIDSVASHAIIPLPTPSPNSFQNALRDSKGKPIIPINTDFAVIIPKIGVNAPVIPGVNPTDTKGYEDALKKGVAHANTSYYPNESGTVYLFSHSTNYEWFVKDLNAVFYLLKNLKESDLVVVMYLGNRYTYKIRETRVVSNEEVSYLSPQSGKRNLILQTCWPPGTAWKRLLIFADLVDEQATSGFGTII